MKNLFRTPDLNEQYEDAMQHTAEQHGGIEAMESYYNNADKIADEYEENRYMTIACSCLNIRDYQLLTSGQVDLVLDREAFDAC